MLLETIMQKMASLITTTKNNIDRFNKKLHKLDKKNKANLQLIEGVLAKNSNRITKNFKELIV